jgi:hypothetical protein
MKCRPAIPLRIAGLRLFAKIKHSAARLERLAFFRFRETLLQSPPGTRNIRARCREPLHHLQQNPFQRKLLQE